MIGNNAWGTVHWRAMGRPLQSKPLIWMHYPRGSRKSDKAPSIACRICHDHLFSHEPYPSTKPSRRSGNIWPRLVCQTIVWPPPDALQSCLMLGLSSPPGATTVRGMSESHLHQPDILAKTVELGFLAGWETLGPARRLDDREMFPRSSSLAFCPPKEKTLAMYASPWDFCPTTFW